MQCRKRNFKQNREKFVFKLQKLKCCGYILTFKKVTKLISEIPLLPLLRFGGRSCHRNWCWWLWTWSNSSSRRPTCGICQPQNGGNTNTQRKIIEGNGQVCDAKLMVKFKLMLIYPLYQIKPLECKKLIIIVYALSTKWRPCLKSQWDRQCRQGRFGMTLCFCP